MDFGNLINEVVGGGHAGVGDAEQQKGVAGALMNMIQQHGGVGGLTDHLRNNGLGQQVDSWMRASRAARSDLRLGTDASSPRVYGCCGLRSSSAERAVSTMAPRNMTAMRSATRETTPRSCEMKSIASPRCSRNCASNSRI